MHGFTKGGEPGTDVLKVMAKVVFFNTLTEPLEWENSTRLAGNAAEAVRTMKDHGGRSMRTIGSRTVDGQLQLVEYVPRVLEGTPGRS